MVTRATEWPPFQPPSYKSTHPTKPNEPLVHLSFQTFPSYGRNWALFGHVDPILREACQKCPIYCVRNSTNTNLFQPTRYLYHHVGIDE